MKVLECLGLIFGVYGAYLMGKYPPSVTTYTEKGHLNIQWTDSEPNIEEAKQYEFWSKKASVFLAVGFGLQLLGILLH